LGVYFLLVFVNQGTKRKCVFRYW